jgi:Cu/Ag efflux protein CusF
MKESLLAASAAMFLSGAITLLHAGDMGNLQGMNMGGMEQTNSPDTSLQTYKVRGLVEKIAPDLHRATIHNETIPGYMDEMTMDFTIQKTNELTGISPGDQITFELVVGQKDEWIENIQRTGKTMPVMTNSMPSMEGSMTNK